MSLKNIYFLFLVVGVLCSSESWASFRGQFLDLPAETMSRFRERTPPPSDTDSSVGSPLTPAVDQSIPAFPAAGQSGTAGVELLLEEVETGSSSPASTSVGDLSSGASSEGGDLSSLIEMDEEEDKSKKIKELQERYHQLNREIRDASFRTPEALSRRLRAQQATLQSQISLTLGNLNTLRPTPENAKVRENLQMTVELLGARHKALEILIQGNRAPTPEIFDVMTLENQNLYTFIHGAPGATAAEKQMTQRRLAYHLKELREKEASRAALEEEMRVAGFKKSVSTRSLADLRRGLRSPSAGMEEK